MSPKTAGYSLATIDALLDEVRANVDHAEAAYNPWALSALRAAERLREFAAAVETALSDEDITDFARLVRAVPTGTDVAELCTSPTPNGRSCLQRVAAGCLVYGCVDCQELLGQLLASVGAER